jgi:hypothetical protein
MLNAKQHRVIAALLVERTDKAAALVADIPYATLRRWLNEPEFKSELAAQQSQIVAVVVNRITAAADILSKRVLDIADNPNLPIGDLIKLVTWALPFAIELNDREALLARIADLEKAHQRPNDPWTVIEGGTPCQKQLP